MPITKTSGQGRPKGVPNKLTADLKSMILGALSDVGGREYLAQQALESPGAFMTLVGKVLPLQVTGENGGAVQFETTVDVSQLTDEQARALASIPLVGRDRSEEGTGETPPDRLH